MNSLQERTAAPETPPVHVKASPRLPTQKPVVSAPFVQAFGATRSSTDKAQEPRLSPGPSAVPSVQRLLPSEKLALRGAAERPGVIRLAGVRPGEVRASRLAARPDGSSSTGSRAARSRADQHPPRAAGRCARDSRPTGTRRAGESVSGALPIVPPSPSPLPLRSGVALRPSATLPRARGFLLLAARAADGTSGGSSAGRDKHCYGRFTPTERGAASPRASARLE